MFSTKSLLLLHRMRIALPVFRTAAVSVLNITKGGTVPPVPPFRSITCTSYAPSPSQSSEIDPSFSKVEPPTKTKYPVPVDELPPSDEDCSSEEDCSSDEEFYEHTSILQDPERYRPPFREVLVRPLIQVFSVSLHKNFDDGRPCEIYGSVCAFNAAQGVISKLYKRPLANPETIPNGGILSLIGGYDNFVTYGPAAEGPATSTTIDLDLKDISCNTEFIKKKHNLHSATEEIEDCSNKLIKDIVHGERGFALIYYTKFLYAICAVVQVGIFNKRDTSDPFVDVYGNITARYGNARQFCSNDDEVRHMECTLFSKPFDHPERVKVGRPMRLSRFMVVMPAFSTLVIDANISDSQGRFIGGSVEFQLPGQGKKLIDDEFGTILVIVRSEDTYYRFHVDADFKDREDGWTQLLRGNNKTDNRKDLAHSDQKQTSSYLGSTRSYSSMAVENNINVEVLYPGSVLVEVFSAYVNGTNHEVSTICGSISVEDTFKPIWCMFERGLDNPELLSHSNGFIPIEGQYLIDSNYAFDIEIYLEDPITAKEVCSGVISFFPTSFLSGHAKATLYQKRLCSVVGGAHGYLVLHYMILDSAYQATVEVRFLSVNPSFVPGSVSGLVVASYNNHTYSTNYEKKFYRSWLFNKPHMRFIQLDDHLRVPLSRSVIAVPKGANLIIEADLQAMSTSNSKKFVFGKKEFKISLSKTMHEEILGKYYGVLISVKFELV